MNLEAAVPCSKSQQPYALHIISLRDTACLQGVEKVCSAGTACLCSRVSCPSRGCCAVQKAAPGHGHALGADAGLALPAADLCIGCCCPGSGYLVQCLDMGCMLWSRASFGMRSQQRTEACCFLHDTHLSLIVLHKIYTHFTPCTYLPLAVQSKKQHMLRCILQFLCRIRICM